jgi:hypothetical protein
MVDRDSILGLELVTLNFNDEGIYGSMPSSKWGNPWDAGYDSKYVVTVSFMGKNLSWHKWAVKPLMDVQAQLVSEGFDKSYHWEDLQTWNKRMIAGTNIPSNHAWPTAIDINPKNNPYTHGALITDIPHRVVEIFMRYDFRWGGNYNSVKDAMHFEYLGEPVKEVERDLYLTKPYMTGNDVLEAQTLLAYYGYAITLDGVFGPKTDAFLRSFQASKMLSVDGVCGLLTKTTLQAKKDDRIIKFGMSGKDVVWVQRIINRVQNAKLVEDGHFGNKMLVAIKSFQKANNLNVDGIVGPKTWKILRHVSN